MIWQKNPLTVFTDRDKLEPILLLLLVTSKIMMLMGGRIHVEKMRCEVFGKDVKMVKQDRLWSILKQCKRYKTRQDIMHSENILNLLVRLEERR